jgi:hypothetical protein
MKKVVFWLTLIVGIVALIGSCAKSEDSTTTASTTASTTTTSGCTVVSSCSATAPTSSNTITGIDNGTLVGTYDKFIHAASAYDIDNSTGCVSDSTLLSAWSASLPTGTASFKYHSVITSTTTWASQNIYYSDNACSTEIASVVFGKSDVSVGDNVTGLTAGSSSAKPTSATKVTYKESCMDLNPSTDAGTTFLNTLITGSGITLVTGTRAICQNSGETRYALWQLDNLTFTMEDSSSALTDWDDPDTLTWLD